MSGGLFNKTAIVTGGGSGIGRAIAVRLAKDGAHVMIVGRTESSLKETASLDEKISYVVGDMTKTETIEKVMAAVKENLAGWTFSSIMLVGARCSRSQRSRSKIMIRRLVWMYAHLWK